ncbi:hypothetical protein IKH83_01380 [Candidatus Saccharibacteria bacterium]|nr:hypothetical protein [Candidatus Saccharibacteria bacterium]
MVERRREVLKKVTGPKIARALNKIFNVVIAKMNYEMFTEMEDFTVRIDVKVNSSEFGIKSELDGQRCRLLYSSKDRNISFVEDWIKDHPDEDSSSDPVNIFHGAACSFGIVEYTMRADPKKVDGDYKMSLSHGKESYHVSIGICRRSPGTWSPSLEWLDSDDSMFDNFKNLFWNTFSVVDCLAIWYGEDALWTAKEKCLDGLCGLTKEIKENINEYLP